MGLTKLRKLFLRQHAYVRELARGVTAAAERTRSDERALPELRDLLDHLFDEMQAHNRREDVELQAILPKIDAWGPIRKELMSARHGAEHAALIEGIQAAALAPTAAGVCERVLRVLADLELHMQREEREFLGADVLRDSVGTNGVAS